MASDPPRTGDPTTPASESPAGESPASVGTNRRHKPQPHHRPVANELGAASGAMASLASAIRQLVQTELLRNLGIA